MAITKLMSITRTDKDDNSNIIIRQPKTYKLSNAINVDINDDSAKIPTLFDDIDKNGILSGLPEISISTIAQYAQKLKQIQDQYLTLWETFSGQVANLENEAIEYLSSIADQNKSHAEDPGEIFKPLYFTFKDHTGEADIKLRISFPLERENKPQILEDNTSDNIENTEVETNNINVQY